jgi:hypothetical protein
LLLPEHPIPWLRHGSYCALHPCWNNVIINPGFKNITANDFAAVVQFRYWSSECGFDEFHG